MSQALQVSRSFFQSKDEEKLEYSPHPEAPIPAGYFRSPQHSQEKNEHFFMVSPTSGFNPYPTNPPQFKQVLEEIYPYFTKLGMLVESIINDCLDLPPNFLKEYNDDRSWDVLLALHYVPASNTETNIGKTCHTDASSVTFVFQDGVEGLEFYGDGKWIPVVPPQGTLVINIGDLIQVPFLT
ncbi:hypothetical protein ACJIZ3_005360 [Penstemon smallii]|uniref:Isopenicillin N synthase-like Fe(2+) 2OG dioxygenase domain-containing protein n=1 Tax=Penstemon smallii TaxID=265156 RepID=A0ABD3S4M7_9LAMI